MTNSPIPLDQLEIIGYADVLPEGKGPAVVPPVFRDRQDGTRCYLPPFQVAGRWLLDPQLVAFAEVQDLAQAQRLTLATDFQPPAQPDWQLWVGLDGTLHYDPLTDAKQHLRNLHHEHLEAATAALSKGKLEAAEEHAGIALAADDSALEPDALLAACHALRGEEKQVSLLRHEAEATGHSPETFGLLLKNYVGMVPAKTRVASCCEAAAAACEKAGLTVPNIRPQDQLAANHELMAEILRELSIGCIVVSQDLTILHANRTAHRYFAQSRRDQAELKFTDLPQALGRMVYRVLKKGVAVVPFRFQPTENEPTVYQVTIVPLLRPAVALPNSALLILEDQTQAEQFKRLEEEAATRRLIRNMSARLAHEINNAVVPLDTCQQMLHQSAADPEFVGCLGRMLADGVKRISRCGLHLRMLAQDTLPTKEALPLAPLLEEAFDEARKHQATPSIHLRVEPTLEPCVVSGSRQELKVALEEAFINAIQANPKEAEVLVSIATELHPGDPSWVHLRIHDRRDHSHRVAPSDATKPFAGTKVVGRDLGLRVCQRIIEMHQGKLSLGDASSGSTGLACISLPLDVNSSPVAPSAASPAVN